MKRNVCPVINALTKVYGVFGNPARHSKGPEIHNAAFRHHGFNAVYLAFEVDDIARAVSAMKTLPIHGASITIPFKTSIMDHLDWIDPDAATVGAVNTVIYHDGRLYGYNTDHKAAVEPLKPMGIKDRRVCIIGAGGAAQAVAYGIHREKGRLIIVNRSADRGQSLAHKYGGEFIPAGDFQTLSQLHPDMIINTTPVGMYPDTGALSFPCQNLDAATIVMDIIYSPLQTRLLNEAASRGCRTIDGLSMFLYQAAAQFNLWTGVAPDIEILRSAFLTHGEP